MTTSLVSRDKSEAKKKGILAAGAWGGTALLVTVGAPWLLALPAAGGAAYMTYKWFMFRAKRGMRF
jgi:hypothetical protein